MGYDLHITRKVEWSDEEGPVITEAEFRQLVADDPELKFNEADSQPDWIVADWNGGPDSIAWTEGEIRTKNPGPQLVAKMARLAATLGARAVGDDGEAYIGGADASAPTAAEATSSATPPPPPPAAPPAPPAVFTAKASASSNAFYQLVTGIVLCAWVPVGFVIAIRSQKNGMLILHLITTLPAIFAVGFLRSYWATRKTPVSVIVSTAGVAVTYATKRVQEMTWGQIGWVMVDLIPHTNTRRLFVFDTAGNKALDIADTISNFDLLVEQVKEGIAKKPDASVAQSVQSKKARKSAYLALTMGIVFTVMACIFVSIHLHEDRDKQAIEQHGVPTLATVTKLQMAPDGITPRLYYTFTPPGGKPIEHNAHVTSELYGLVKVGDPVPVFYVPSDPENNRLIADEIVDEMRMPPIVNFATPIILIVLSLLLFFESYLKFHGKGIDRDSKTGKFSIKKFGEGA